MATIPQEIIFDIFSRLPVKSLCRFKCVSKPFLTLISEPCFIKSHLTQTRTQRILAFDCSNLFFLDCKTSNDNKLFTSELEVSKQNQRVHLFGSCNGLLWLNVPERESFMLCNPSTRETCKEIPHPQTQFLPVDYLFHISYGFGYAQSIDDYKFVIVLWISKAVHVFSLRNNSWKVIDNRNFCLGIITGGPGTHLNGAIHWLLDDEKLAAFDLVEEKFKTLPLPKTVENVLLLSLEVLDGERLSIFMISSNQDYELWVMNEYGVEDSWTRIWIAKDQMLYLFRPLNFRIKNSGMIFLTDKIYPAFGFSYQENDGRWNRVDVYGLDPDQEFEVQLYVESLVSPNCYISEG